MDATRTAELGASWEAQVAQLPRIARMLAGLEQREVAARLGVSQAAISALERGTGGLTVHRLVRAVAACGFVPLPVVLLPVDEWLRRVDLQVARQAAMAAEAARPAGPSGVNVALADYGGALAPGEVPDARGPSGWLGDPARGTVLRRGERTDLAPGVER